MLLQNSDKTMDAGPLDVICILHDTELGTYHAAFFEERPFPGPVQPISRTETVRLMSKMHHIAGSLTLEGAKEHVAELRKNIHVSDDNVWTDPVEWDGKVPVVLVVPNWKKSE